MQFDLKQLRLIPATIMVVLSFGSSMDFNVIGQSAISYASLALQLVSCVLAFYLIVRQNSISLLDGIYCSFLILIFVSSIISKTEMKEWIYVSLRCCLLLFFFNYYRDNLKPLIFGLTIGYSFAVIFQFVQLITHPEMWIIQDDKVISEYVLGGNYNQMGGYLIVTMMLIMLSCHIKHILIPLFVPVYIICLAIPVIVASMTAATCLAMFFLICAMPWNRLKRICSFSILSVFALFQFFICFRGKGIENSNLAVWFIEDILQKDITFTNRTLMWSSAINIIPESLIYGFGFPGKEWYYANMESFAIGPHNALIAMLIYGGIIGLVIYMFLLLHAITTVLFINDKISNNILASLAIISTMMLMEVYPVFIIFLLFTLAEYYPDLCRQLQTA